MTCLNPKPVKYEWYNKIDEKTGETYKTKRIIFIPYSETDETTDYIPCNTCAGCRTDQANDWATKAYMESQNWPQNAFLTLTYNDDNLPAKKSLQKADLQKFWKRLRKHINQKIKYMACGEYGTTTNRPHYHAAVFNYWPNDCKTYKTNANGDQLYTSEQLNRIWGLGYVIIGRLTYQSAAYIARYVFKKSYGDYKKFTNKENEFITASKRPAIAKNWFDNKKLWDYLKRNSGIFIPTKDGLKIKPIPKYLKNKFKESDRETYFAEQDAKKEKNIKNQKEILKNTSLNYNYYQKMKAQQKKDSLKRLDKFRTIN